MVEQLFRTGLSSIAKILLQKSSMSDIAVV